MEKNIISPDYLRISLTDRCNLNCIYCTPLEKSGFLDSERVLSYEELARAVNLFTRLGVSKVRLTGGEPLIRKNITDFIKMLKAINGLEELAMTTNAVLLKDSAFELKEVGISRLNISLDTLKKEKFKFITGVDCFNDVWEGIKMSLEAGFKPLKLNVILMRGINNDEISDFVRLAFEYPLIVRFIEFFPTNTRSSKFSDSVVKTEDTKRIISKSFGELYSVSGIKGNGPAEYYKLKNLEGEIGFISSFSENFCNKCNRMRLDCAGRISPCLFSGYTHDMLPLLRARLSDEAVLVYLKEAFKLKSDFRKDTLHNFELEMSSIGG